MKLIILLGGRGTRMRPFTWSRPKALLTLTHTTVIGHILDKLSPHISQEIILVVGYLGEQIEAWVREQYPQLDVHFIYQNEAFGQAHAAWLCRNFLTDDSEILMSMGDLIIDADYTNLRQFTTAETNALFHTLTVDDPSRYGVLQLDANGYVTEIVEKPKSGHYTQAFAGTYWFKSGRYLRHYLEQTIESGKKTNGEFFIADTFQLMLAAGSPMRTQPINWTVDAGTPTNLLAANRFLLEQTATQPFPNYPHAVIIPPVSIHPTAVIENSVIGPHVTLAPQTTIKNARITNCIIEAGSTVEAAVLQHSLIGRNTIIQATPTQLILGDNNHYQG